MSRVCGHEAGCRGCGHEAVGQQFLEPAAPGRGQPQEFRQDLRRQASREIGDEVEAGAEPAQEGA